MGNGGGSGGGDNIWRDDWSSHPNNKILTYHRHFEIQSNSKIRRTLF